MGRDWQQRHVPARDAGADGLAAGHEDLWLGLESGAADDDQVWGEEYPGAIGA